MNSLEIVDQNDDDANDENDNESEYNGNGQVVPLQMVRSFIAHGEWVTGTPCDGKPNLNSFECADGFFTSHMLCGLPIAHSGSPSSGCEQLFGCHSGCITASLFQLCLSSFQVFDGSVNINKSTERILYLSIPSHRYVTRIQQRSSGWLMVVQL